MEGGTKLAVQLNGTGQVERAKIGRVRDTENEGTARQRYSPSQLEGAAADCHGAVVIERNTYINRPGSENVEQPRIVDVGRAFTISGGSGRHGDRSRKKVGKL